MSSKTKPQEKEYWETRPLDDSKRDWGEQGLNWVDDYWNSQNHPHRKLILGALETFEPESILEVGCNCGPNLALIRRRFNIPDTHLAGVDPSITAIAKAIEELPAINYQVGTASRLPFPDKSFDVIISDAALLYVGPDEINEVVKEFDRVAKKGLILVEWYDAKSTEGVIKDYHWARNYEKLFKEFEGVSIKLTEETWPTKTWIENGRVFIFHRPSPTSKKSSKKSK